MAVTERDFLFQVHVSEILFFREFDSFGIKLPKIGDLPAKETWEEK